MTREVYGWRPQLIDNRDFLLARMPNVDFGLALPASMDLRPSSPPIFNQGQLGSCTANATVGAYQIDALEGFLAKAGHTPPNDLINNALLSRLFLYYNSRAMEGTTASDAGAVLRDVIKSVATMGCSLESLWPYHINDFTVKPPETAYTDALKHKALIYASVQNNPTSIKTAVANKLPVIFGFTCFESLESAETDATGIIPMPAPGEATIGGHAVCVVGYGQKPGYYLIRNSWGDKLGDAGYYYMSEAYMSQYAQDHWVLKSVESI